jgi:hypothetical protein
MRKIAVKKKNSAQCSIKVREVIKDGLETNKIPD